MTPRRASIGGSSLSTENPWETFFDLHAPVYDSNIFTQNTVAEVDFLLRELALPPGGSILDIGCGTGRHSIELARRGYSVTGLDLSSGMLRRAAHAARAANVHVRWIRADATRCVVASRFDAVICLCEGAFGLLSQDDSPLDQPLAILSSISRSLRPKARAVLTVLNAMAMIRKYHDSDVQAGRFDPLSLVEYSKCAPTEGESVITVRERGFVATELALLLRLAGLAVLHLWGGTAGAWDKRPPRLDEMELMAVVQKIAENEPQSAQTRCLPDEGGSSGGTES